MQVLLQQSIHYGHVPRNTSHGADNCVFLIYFQCGKCQLVPMTRLSSLFRYLHEVCKTSMHWVSHAKSLSTCYLRPILVLGKSPGWMQFPEKAEFYAYANLAPSDNWVPRYLQPFLFCTAYQLMALIPCAQPAVLTIMACSWLIQLSFAFICSALSIGSEEGISHGQEEKGEISG